MATTERRPYMRANLRQWLWFVALWLAGVLTVAGVAYALRGLMALI